MATDQDGRVLTAASRRLRVCGAGAATPGWRDAAGSACQNISVAEHESQGVPDMLDYPSRVRCRIVPRGAWITHTGRPVSPGRSPAELDKGWGGVGGGEVT